MNDDPVQALADELVARGHDALLERLRVAFAQAAAAHSDIIQLDDARLEQVVQNFAPRADGLQWRRALASVAAEELGIDVGQALNHPAVARAQQMLGAPSYEDSLAELINRPVPESPEAALADARNGAPAPFAEAATYEEETPAPTDTETPAPTDEETLALAEEEETPLPAEEATYAEQPVDAEQAIQTEEPEYPAEEAEPAEAEAEAATETPGLAESEPAPWESAAFETAESDPTAEPEPEPWAAAGEPEHEAEPDHQPALGFEHEPPYAPPDPYAAPPDPYAAPPDPYAAPPPEPYAAPPDPYAAPPAAYADAPDPYGAETQSYEAAGASDIARLAPDESEFDPAELEPSEASRFAALPSYESDEDEDRLRVTAIHLGGVANLTGSSDSVDLRLSEAGLDIMRDEDEIIGRLGWADIETLEVPNPRGLRRRRGMSRAQLIVRTPSGDASFEIPAFSSDELRQRIEPLVDRFGRH